MSGDLAQSDTGDITMASVNPSQLRRVSDTVSDATRARSIRGTSHGRMTDRCAPIRALEDSLLICGDAQRALALLPSETIQTVVTSPPYWSLRDYHVDE